MNVKKTIALSILLFANVIMLVHAVVPHHHHDGMLFLSSFIQHENIPQHCNYTHCHDGIEDCALVNDYTRFDNDGQTFQLHDFNSTLFLVYSITQIENNADLPFRQKPYLPLFYSEFISQSLNLRAPPVC